MRICIVCQEDVSGRRAVKVKEDRIIKAIRKIKQTFNIATNNELYVSEECIPKHKERRRAFERSMLSFGILAAIIVVLMLSSIVLSGKFDLGMIISAFLIGGFILLFALIFKYTPAVEGEVAAAVPGTPVPRKEEKAQVPKEEKPQPEKSNEEKPAENADKGE